MASTAPLYAPFILAPPLTSCTTAYIVYGQGTPPYTLSVIPTGGNGSLEVLPERQRAGVARWRVDFDEGANITFALTDGTGAQAYSQYRVVQAGEVTTCSKTDYSTKKTSNVGPILGAVLGVLGAVALAGLAFWWRRRELRRRRGSASRGSGLASKTPSVVDMDDMRLADGPAGVVRAGTFNLGNRGVQFTEASLDRLREMDRPPNYDDEGDRTPPPALDEPAGAATAVESAAAGRGTAEAGAPRAARRNRLREAQERRDRGLAERIVMQQEREEAERAAEGGSAGGERRGGDDIEEA
ncbi:hypothetical protein JCM8097_003406 [Rhodosporidiobolus ruineniae]